MNTPYSSYLSFINKEGVTNTFICLYWQNVLRAIQLELCIQNVTIDKRIVICDSLRCLTYDSNILNCLEFISQSDMAQRL